MRYADRIETMRNGAIGARGPTEEAMTSRAGLGTIPSRLLGNDEAGLRLGISHSGSRARTLTFWNARIGENKSS